MSDYLLKIRVLLNQLSYLDSLIVDILKSLFEIGSLLKQIEHKYILMLAEFSN